MKQKFYWRCFLVMIGFVIWWGYIAIHYKVPFIFFIIGGVLVCLGYNAMEREMK